MWVDRAGILWVGAASLDRASITENGINRYKLRGADKLSPPVRSFAEFRRQVWVGASHSIFQYERNNNQLKFRKEYSAVGYRHGHHTVNANSVLDMKTDSGGLWVGTEDAGLIYYPFTKDYLLNLDKAEYFNQNSTVKLPGDKVCCLVLSPHNASVVWVGTLQSGFMKLNKKADGTYEQSVYQAATGDLSDNNVRALFEDTKGRLWIGTQDGLNCFDPNSQSFQRFYYSPTDQLSLNDNIVNTIFEDRSGNLWIGTNSGLNKLVTTTSSNGKPIFQFKGYPDIEYLSNEIVSNLMDDDEGNLWIRMYRGFVKFNIQQEEVVGKYFSRDYENIRFERNSTLKLHDKQVMVDAQGGFLTFTPNNSATNSTPPKVVITDLQLLNRSLQTDGALRHKLALSQTIPYTSQLRLSYKEKMITIVFSAMDYKNPSKNDYYYKLEGFDSQWIHSASHNSATYTNLPHGEYLFKVKAKNSDGVWSTDETVLLLHITPPFWKTIWAYLFYCLLLACIVYFFNQYSIIRAQEKSTLRFEKLKAEEMQRLNEMKSFFFTDITHELKTPLSLIIGPANELAADKNLFPASLRHAELIKNSAMKLLRLVNQLLEFRKMEKGIPEQLLIQSVDIGAVLKDISGLFSAMSESRRISFQLLLPSSPFVARLDPDKFEKIIFNLISNAFKYTRDKGWIRVETYLKTENDGRQLIVISVSDNGIGISEEHKSKIFERFYQVNQIRTQSTGGIGLYMAKALVEQHQGSIAVDSELGKGSCFTVQLPFVAAAEITVDPNTETNATKNGQNKEAETDQLDSEFEIPLPNCLTILVLEDDRELNESLVNGLSSEFKVLSAHNGQKGLEISRKEMPDLILSDIMMPEMNGFEFCKQLRKDLNCSHIPVVFLTAKTMQEDELKGLRLGAVDYIFKPFNLVSLKLKLHNILATRRQIQDKLRKELILEPDNIELSSLDEIFMKQAVEAVQNKLDDPTFDVDAFSRDMGASSNQVYRKIKALTGQTAKEFIRNQRLKIAAGMLVQKKRNISEIIYMVGFSNPSYFARCFKEFYGCTPKEYMEKSGEADSNSHSG
ncbi:MAG: ATP-binding protein [Mangrovibacterium sp.]